MIWTNEDGDDYYATGHRTSDEMIALIINYERETVRAEVSTRDFWCNGVEPRHYWVRWIDDEHAEEVEPGSPGSEKNTSFSPDLDWDQIDDRGDGGDRV